MNELRSGLPGADLIDEGCADLDAGRETVAALLVAVGAGRLRAAGAAVPDGPLPQDPEHRLYALLCAREGRAAYGRYNSLVRLLVSHERALEQQVGKRWRAARRGPAPTRP